MQSFNDLIIHDLNSAIEIIPHQSEEYYKILHEKVLKLLADYSIRSHHWDKAQDVITLSKKLGVDLSTLLFLAIERKNVYVIKFLLNRNMEKTNISFARFFKMLTQQTKTENEILESLANNNERLNIIQNEDLSHEDLLQIANDLSSLINEIIKVRVVGKINIIQYLNSLAKQFKLVINIDIDKAWEAAINYREPALLKFMQDEDQLHLSINHFIKMIQLVDFNSVDYRHEILQYLSENKIKIKETLTPEEKKEIILNIRKTLPNMQSRYIQMKEYLVQLALDIDEASLMDLINDAIGNDDLEIIELIGRLDKNNSGIVNSINAEQLYWLMESWKSREIRNIRYNTKSEILKYIVQQKIPFKFDRNNQSSSFVNRLIPYLIMNIKKVIKNADWETANYLFKCGMQINDNFGAILCNIKPHLCTNEDDLLLNVYIAIVSGNSKLLNACIPHLRLDIKSIKDFVKYIFKNNKKIFDFLLENQFYYAYATKADYHWFYDRGKETVENEFHHFQYIKYFKLAGYRLGNIDSIYLSHLFQGYFETLRSKRLNNDPNTSLDQNEMYLIFEPIKTMLDNLELCNYALICSEELNSIQKYITQLEDSILNDKKTGKSRRISLANKWIDKLEFYIYELKSLKDSVINFEIDEFISSINFDTSSDDVPNLCSEKISDLCSNQFELIQSNPPKKTALDFIISYKEDKLKKLKDEDRKINKSDYDKVIAQLSNAADQLILQEYDRALSLLNKDSFFSSLLNPHEIKKLKNEIKSNCEAIKDIIIYLRAQPKINHNVKLTELIVKIRKCKKLNDKLVAEYSKKSTKKSDPVSPPSQPLNKKLRLSSLPQSKLPTTRVNLQHAFNPKIPPAQSNSSKNDQDTDRDEIFSEEDSPISHIPPGATSSPMKSNSHTDIPAIPPVKDKDSIIVPPEAPVIPLIEKKPVTDVPPVAPEKLDKENAKPLAETSALPHIEEKPLTDVPPAPFESPDKKSEITLIDIPIIPSVKDNDSTNAPIVAPQAPDEIKENPITDIPHVIFDNDNLFHVDPKDTSSAVSFLSSIDANIFSPTEEDKLVFPEISPSSTNTLSKDLVAITNLVAITSFQPLPTSQEEFKNLSFNTLYTQILDAKIRSERKNESKSEFSSESESLSDESTDHLSDTSGDSDYSSDTDHSWDTDCSSDSETWNSEDDEKYFPPVKKKIVPEIKKKVEKINPVNDVIMLDAKKLKSFDPITHMFDILKVEIVKEVKISKSETKMKTFKRKIDYINNQIKNKPTNGAGNILLSKLVSEANGSSNDYENDTIYKYFTKRKNHFLIGSIAKSIIKTYYHQTLPFKDKPIAKQDELLREVDNLFNVFRIKNVDAIYNELVDTKTKIMIAMDECYAALAKLSDQNALHQSKINLYKDLRNKYNSLPLASSLLNDSQLKPQLTNAKMLLMQTHDFLIASEEEVEYCNAVARNICYSKSKILDNLENIYNNFSKFSGTNEIQTLIEKLIIAKPTQANQLFAFSSLNEGQISLDNQFLTTVTAPRESDYYRLANGAKCSFFRNLPKLPIDHARQTMKSIKCKNDKTKAFAGIHHFSLRNNCLSNEPIHIDLYLTKEESELYFSKQITLSYDEQQKKQAVFDKIFSFALFENKKYLNNAFTIQDWIKIFENYFDNLQTLQQKQLDNGHRQFKK